MQEKYKKLMMSNVQLDNEKQALSYQLELYKDLLSDKNEEFLEMKSRLHKVALVSLCQVLSCSRCHRFCHQLLIESFVAKMSTSLAETALSPL